MPIEWEQKYKDNLYRQNCILYYYITHQPHSTAISDIYFSHHTSSLFIYQNSK